MKVNEIFFSLQGEGVLTGWPTVFVRFTGCNLSCSYCDTSYARHEGKQYLPTEIVKEIAKFDCKRVCLTGGEPLLQKDFIELLILLKDYRVSIETNGSISVKEFMLFSGHTINMDVKAPSSGENKSIYQDNMNYLREDDEIKFVLASNKDYLWAKEFIANYYQKGLITFSPVFGVLSPDKLAAWVLEDKLDVRVQVQLHKIIWGPDKKGV